MFCKGGEGGYNGVTRTALFVDFKEEIKGWDARLGIEDKGYVILQ